MSTLAEAESESSRWTKRETGRQPEREICVFLFDRHTGNDRSVKMQRKEGKEDGAREMVCSIKEPQSSRKKRGEKVMDG